MLFFHWYISCSSIKPPHLLCVQDFVYHFLAALFYLSASVPLALVTLGYSKDRSNLKYYQIDIAAVVRTSARLTTSTAPTHPHTHEQLRVSHRHAIDLCTQDQARSGNSHGPYFSKKDVCALIVKEARTGTDKHTHTHTHTHQHHTHTHTAITTHTGR